MKKIFLFLSIFTFVVQACDVTVSIAPSTSPAPLPTETIVLATLVHDATPTQVPASATQVPPTVAPYSTATIVPPVVIGAEVTILPLTMNLPPGLATGVTGRELPRVDGADVAWWQKTPGYTLITLDNYPLQGKTRQPQIYVFPATAYAEMLPAAFESIRRLDNILYGPGGPSLNGDRLPEIPFFNEAPAFASNAQVISFQSGQGVRFLTQYSQSAASVNNHDLFYHFQGLSRDGTYYIVAIFPITAPGLAQTSDAGAPLPPGGIPYSYMADPTTDMKAYYAAITNLLNSTSQDAFFPTIGQLDTLIQSMQITP